MFSRRIFCVSAATAAKAAAGIVLIAIINLAVKGAHIKSKESWLNREVTGFGLTSLFSDMSHEVATTLLPLFLASIGAPPYSVGFVEGIADGLASLGKIIGGWVSDRTKERKVLAVAGYAVMAVAQGMFGFCVNWTQVLAVRSAGWFGRGWRSPIQNALFHDAVTVETSGRAFGFERTMDTLGAVIAPAAVFFLLPVIGYRDLFFLTWIPGLIAVLCFQFLTKDHRTEHHDFNFSFHEALREMPKDFKKFLVAVTLFGLSDFSNALVIFWTGFLLKPEYGAVKASSLVILMYVFHNITNALAAYPAGWLADRIGKFRVLGFGYLLACLFYFLFIFADGNVFLLFALFGIRGVFLAIIHTLERAIAGDLLTSSIKGTGYGLLASMNGIGDFCSSILVGFLFTTKSSVGSFGYCFLMAAAGTFFLMRITPKPQKT